MTLSSRLAWVLLTAATLCTSRVMAQTPDRPIQPLTRFGANVADSFTGLNLALHLTAVATTPVVVASDADMTLHNFWVRHQALEPYSLPGVYLGYTLPLLAAGSLAAYGWLGSSRRELAAASAVVQATVVSVVYQSVLKTFTGRPAPDPRLYESHDASRRFRFGLLRGGIHYGWPSGHMMTTTAVATSLWPIYPDSVGLRVGSSALIVVMAGSVAMHEKASMHWSSDMLAGTLMGIAIGRGVGGGFAERLGMPRGTVSDVTLTPTISSERTEVVLSGTF
jgi:hypothetical protein